MHNLEDNHASIFMRQGRQHMKSELASLYCLGCPYTTSFVQHVPLHFHLNNSLLNQKTIPPMPITKMTINKNCQRPVRVQPTYSVADGPSLQVKIQNRGVSLSAARLTCRIVHHSIIPLLIEALLTGPLNNHTIKLPM